jgi:hypothetical protein
MKLKENLFELNVLNEIKCYILITLVYMPNIHVDWYGIKITCFQKFLLKCLGLAEN